MVLKWWSCDRQQVQSYTKHGKQHVISMLPNTAFYTGNMPDVHTKHILLYIIFTQSNACFVTTKKKSIDGIR